jgi:hypothetical protein
MAADCNCGDKDCKVYSLDNILLEKSRLEAVQQMGMMTEADEAILSILDQWLAHYAARHANQA